MRLAIKWRLVLISLFTFALILTKIPLPSSLFGKLPLFQAESSFFETIALVIIFLTAISVLIDYLNSKSAILSLLGNKASKFRKKKFPKDFDILIQTIQKNYDSESEKYAIRKADRDLFDLLMDNISDGILIVDQDGSVARINESARKIFNIESENSIQNSLTEIIRDHRINELYSLCTQSNKQQSITIETSPNRLYIQCIATPLSPKMPGSVLLLFQDLTRLRQLEIVRRDFVSNVSHELRTPLTSLKLIAETLQDGALDDNKATLKFLQKMDGEVDNLTQLVEELLELSRIESGRVPLELKPVDPKKLVQSACDRMSLQVERAGLTLNLALAEDLPLINADSQRLGQVLINLLHNAVKFTPPGGKIIISVRHEAGFIVFSVSDTGRGIAGKDLERVFERFFKSDRSRSERGTGLGLSISRHLVEAHKGSIWVESEPGRGSVFSFKIPISQ